MRQAGVYIIRADHNKDAQAKQQAEATGAADDTAAAAAEQVPVWTAVVVLQSGVQVSSICWQLDVGLGPADDLFRLREATGNSRTCVAQAKKSAAEARAWIQNWRDNGVQFAEEVTEEAAQQTSGLFGGDVLSNVSMVSRQTKLCSATAQLSCTG